MAGFELPVNLLFLTEPTETQRKKEGEKVRGEEDKRILSASSILKKIADKDTSSIRVIRGFIKFAGESGLSAY